jgi:hypothetical protein
LSEYCGGHSLRTLGDGYLFRGKAFSK